MTIKKRLARSNIAMLVIPLLVAAVIAFSRLYLFVHYPTDILAGAGLCAAIGFAAYQIGTRRR